MARLAAICLLVVVSAAVACAASSQYTPVYTWSNTDVLGDGSASQVHYQTASTSSLVIDEFLTSEKTDGQLFGKQTLASDAVLAVYIDTKLAPNQPNVQALVRQAKSSIVFPNAEVTPSNEDLVVTLAEHFKSSTAAKVLGCSDSGADMTELDLASAELRVVVLCRSESDVDSFEGLQKALEASNRPYVTVYIPSQQQAAAEDESVAATRRSLLSTNSFGPYSTCDAACQTQVRWLEGILAGLFLVLASMSGLCCLYFLDTPSKFETPKDSSQQ